MSRFLVGLSLIAMLIPSSVFSGVMDHCPACAGDAVFRVSPASGCVNLLILEDDVAVRNFSKKLEKIVYKGRSTAEFEKLPAPKRAEVFNAAFQETTSVYKTALEANAPDVLFGRVSPDALSVSELIANEVLPTEQTRARLYFTLARKYKLKVEVLIGFEDGPSVCKENSGTPQVFGLVGDKETASIFRLGHTPEEWAPQKIDLTPAPGQVVQFGGKSIRLVQMFGSARAPAQVQAASPAEETLSPAFCSLTDAEFRKEVCKTPAPGAPQ